MISKNKTGVALLLSIHVVVNYGMEDKKENINFMKNLLERRGADFQFIQFYEAEQEQKMFSDMVKKSLINLDQYILDQYIVDKHCKTPIKKPIAPEELNSTTYTMALAVPYQDATLGCENEKNDVKECIEEFTNNMINDDKNLDLSNCSKNNQKTGMTASVIGWLLGNNNKK